MNARTDPSVTTEHLLEAFRFRLEQRFGRHAFHDDITVRSLYEAMIDQWVYAVEVRVWGYQDPTAANTIRYPLTWWDAFKDRWFPAWALRRWPVEFKSVCLHPMALFPDWRPPLRTREFTTFVVHTLGKPKVSHIESEA